jgi:uncharacterized OsmC-like protein
MVTVTQKSVVSYRLEGACPSHTRTEVKVRDVEATIDEPRERGGSNLGPTPTEAVFAALLGCTNVVLHRIAARMGVPIENLSLSANAQFDRRGVLMEEEIAVPFPEAKLEVRFDTTASAAQVAELRTALARYCPVSKLLRQAGTRLEETFDVKHR